MRNNPNLDLVSFNAYAKFGQIPSILSQDIERKRSRNHGMTDNLKTVYPRPHTLYAGGILVVIGHPLLEGSRNFTLYKCCFYVIYQLTH